jgi:hypothetical protein
LPDRKIRLSIADLSGGRNGFDPAWAIQDTESADAVNVDFYRTKFGNKRGGMAVMATTGATTTGIISSLFRHVPGTDDTAAEFWDVDDSATPIINRLAAGTTWTAPTLKDAPTGNGWDFTFASINGKLAMAYKSAQDRLHVWDGSTVRRAGLATPVAPTAANTGAGGSIAFDAVSTLVYAGGTTFTHTCAVGATILFVWARADTGAVTGITYNGVAMTQITTVAGGGNYYLFYLVSPASGAHTVAITSTSNVGGFGVSYVGTAIVGIPDTSSTTGPTAATTVSIGLTTTADSDWAIFCAEDRSGASPTANTNTTLRVANATNSAAIFDSNSNISPPGSFTQIANVTVGSNATAMSAAFQSAAPALAAILRYYRVRWTRQSAGITIGRSEPGAALTFTPSGAGTAARITQPSVANEGETHWEVEASTDGDTFYRLATIAIGTTTYDDGAATTSYPNNPLSDLTGTYTLQKSYKFIAADQNRLLGFGSWTSTDKQARIEISAVIGSLDVGDEERVDTSLVNSYVDLDENDSGVPTGLNGPILGSFFAFKDRQVAQLTATGEPEQPYRVDFLSKSIGAIAHVAITRGEDRDGGAALYWMSHRGPYRWSINGLEYIGRNVEDYVLGGNATINLGATKRVAVTQFFPDKRQVWFWWATSNSNDPNVGFIFDIYSGGWTRVPTGDKWANVRCASLFANTIAASMSRDLKIYVGQTGANNRILKTDTGTDDIGTAYQAYQLTKAYEAGGAGMAGVMGDAVLLAKTATSVTITDTVVPDFDASRAATSTCDLTAVGSETRVTRRFMGSGFAEELKFAQHQIGDAAAVSNSWTLDRVVIPLGKAAAVGA